MKKSRDLRQIFGGQIDIPYELHVTEFESAKSSGLSRECHRLDLSIPCAEVMETSLRNVA